MRSYRNQISYRSNSESVAHTDLDGGVINGYLVHPVFLQAVEIKTSKFDKLLESDCEDANQTLDFKTDRLKQY